MAAVPHASLAGPAVEILARYPEGHQRSAVMPLLRLAQEQDGYITEAAVEEIAGIIGLSSAEVVAVASFYTLFHLKPKGRHVISVCHNIACTMAGAEEIIEALEEELGIGSENETTPDGAFTLERAECLATCEIAPCIQVDHDAMIKVSPASALTLLEELRALPSPDGPGAAPRWQAPSQPSDPRSV
ncbi:MAG: NADH-quinone oxidoreductase subunit NuoE [Actinomycetota bacterium]